MGLVLLRAGVVIGVNLLSLGDWYLRAANHMALIVLLIIGAYVFFVMAATEVRGLHRQIGGALLLGIGSLHWTIIGALAVAIAEAFMLRFAVALFPLLGAVLPFLARSEERRVGKECRSQRLAGLEHNAWAELSVRRVEDT